MRNPALKQVTMKKGHYSLSRHSDSEGDTGIMLVSVNNRTGKVFKNGVIKVGKCIRCGSLTGRSFQAQDYWHTTPVTKIISVNKDKTVVVFTTLNSTYTVKSF